MNTRELESFLWRCGLIGLGLLTYSVVMSLVFRTTVLSIHEALYPDLTAEQISSHLYLLTGFMKILIFSLFIVPALSLLWMRKTNRLSE